MEPGLTAKQRQYLRGLGHSQKPLVQIGAKGIGERVLEQLREQLVAHELVKVRFNTESAVEPADVAAELALQTKSQLVQQSGRVLLLYRRSDQKPSIELPKRARPGRPGGATKSVEQQSSGPRTEGSSVPRLPSEAEPSPSEGR